MCELEEKLGQVSSNERKILQCLSLFWEPITAQEFHRLLKVLGLKTPEGKGYSAQYVSLLRNSLVHKGILRNIKEYWGSGFQITDEPLKEFLTREAVREGWFGEAVEKIQGEFSAEEFSRWYGNSERRQSRLLRDYRLSIYQKQAEKTADIFEQIVENEIVDRANQIVRHIFSNPFQRDFLGQFEEKFQAYVIPFLLRDALEKSESAEELWDFAATRNLDDFPIIKGYKIEELLLRGDVAGAEKTIGEPENLGQIISAGTIAFLKQDYEKSVAFYEEGVKLWRKTFSKKKGFPASWQMFFYGLALYKIDEAKFHKFAEDYSIFALKNYPETTIHQAVSAVSYFLKNNDHLAETAYSQIGSDDLAERFLKIIVGAIVPEFKTPNFAVTFAHTANVSGYRWIEFEIANLRKIKGHSGAANDYENLHRELNFEPVGNIVPKLEDWERALNTLLMIAQKGAGKTESKATIDEMRVAWQLDFDNREVQPVEQKYGKKGWTDGRNIALKRLNERDVKNLTEQDAATVKNSLKRHQSYYYYGSYEFEFDWQKSIESLVGHPFLFLKKNPSVNVHLNHAEPNLVIKEIGDELEISFDTKITDEGIIIQKETETRYKVVRISKSHVDIFNSLKAGKLRVPAKGREKLLKAIQPLTTKIAVQSDLEEHFENLPFVEPENRIHALITPSGENFHLEFFVKPFGKIPPYFKPGKGTESILADLDGVRTRTKRDLKNERKLLNEIEAACPFLAEFESQNYEWELVDAEACLTAMSEMETPRRSGKLVIEWTKGQKLNLLGNINFENFSLAVKGTNNWFEVSGEAKINEDLVLSMQDLTKLLTTENTNFVELSDGQFVAITEKLRKYLQSLNAATDDKNRLHNLRSGILEELSEDLENFKADKAWKNHLEKIKQAQKFVPELPATFEADLRPYQIDGFFWLSRLAKWGVGACLADDMGLGKAQPLDAKLLTKKGWMLMADVKVGDKIYGSKGKLVKFSGVFPQGEKDIYKVTFSDKSSTECCLDHLWTVNTPLRNSRNYLPKTLSLRQIVDFGLRDKAGNCNWFIPIAEAVEFETKDFYLDPYLLGVLIGDGGLTHGISFSSVDKEVISTASELLPENYQLKHIDRCDYRIVKVDGEKFDANFITREIKRLSLNTRSENKHIPFDYLHANIKQRTSLLQGLLDTDGYCSKESTVQFYTTSEELADNVTFLVRSLGGLVRKSIKTTTHRDCYVLTLALPDNIKPFRLSRKASRYQPRIKYKPSRAIISVESIGKKQAQCIKVDAADSLYLTDDFILTHNTLQALAILVERAEQGAALVVAPVSVCRNWVKEAMRFAPTLNFQIFGEGERKSAVENLGKYDVLVTSYNLLQLEEELFTTRKFATIVLDEAQAIKNRHTKRSKTVMNLQGDFRLITTGTPIENHLGELWNLFNFINPGLLGNHDFFNEKFAAPIEKTKDETARRTLQKLIKPFVLRRRKNQVLDDLPAKTEIVLTVEMSPEERAFYEAIRREALEKIESQDGEAKDKRFRILAELTRLRLACCHPKLVNENVPLGSSKLELFGETLEELLENKHKALVFSQFVKHLQIVKNYLDEKEISYQYLDGSTPPHVRQERIDEFQRGTGDVFLISLKAGGTGLNLTAADYVIHLDPWWNPAVEDQATDRVHRIGQQRPVTVYRLVTENTVEEKILKLHDTKRDLADSLLDGTDTSGKLSADDLLALIAEA